MGLITDFDSIISYYILKYRMDKYPEFFKRMKLRYNIHKIEKSRDSIDKVVYLDLETLKEYFEFITSIKLGYIENIHTECKSINFANNDKASRIYTYTEGIKNQDSSIDNMIVYSVVENFNSRNELISYNLIFDIVDNIGIKRYRFNLNDNREFVINKDLDIIYGVDNNPANHEDNIEILLSRLTLLIIKDIKSYITNSINRAKEILNDTEK